MRILVTQETLLWRYCAWSSGAKSFRQPARIVGGRKGCTYGSKRVVLDHAPNYELNAKIMAILKELCSTIPVQMMRDQVMRELNRRKALSYASRMEALGKEAHVFDRCVQRRPERGKAKNTASREEAGTIGNVVVGIRTSWNSVVVCKSKKKD